MSENKGILGKVLFKECHTKMAYPQFGKKNKQKKHPPKQPKKKCGTVIWMGIAILCVLHFGMNSLFSVQHTRQIQVISSQTNKLQRILTNAHIPFSLYLLQKKKKTKDIKGKNQTTVDKTNMYIFLLFCFGLCGTGVKFNKIANGYVIVKWISVVKCIWISFHIKKLNNTKNKKSLTII